MAGFMGLIFVIIVAMGVGVPVSQNVIATLNLSGIDATIAGFVITFLILAVLALTARMGGIA